MLLCSLVFMFTPSYYYSSKLKVIPKKVDGKIKDEVKKCKNKYSICSIYEVRASLPDERDPNFIYKHKSALTNGVFFSLLMARCVVLAIRGMIQFWHVKYVASICPGIDKKLNNWVYFFMVWGNPLLGNILGGYLTGLAGGYGDKRCMWVLLGFNLVSTLGFTPASFTEDWRKFCVFVGIFQIAGNALLPSMQGVMMEAIPKEIRAKSGVIASVAAVFLGNIPSPPVYGAIMDFYGKYDKHIGMRWFSYYAYVGFFWIVIATIFKHYYDAKEHKESKGEELIADKKPKKHVPVVAMDPDGLDPYVEGRDDEDEEEEEDSELEQIDTRKRRKK